MVLVIHISEHLSLFAKSLLETAILISMWLSCKKKKKPTELRTQNWTFKCMYRKDCVSMNTKGEHCTNTYELNHYATHQANTSGGQIGNWIINYKEPRLSSAAEEKRDVMEVERRKERTAALNKSSVFLSCPCRNSRCATWLKFPGLIAVK